MKRTNQGFTLIELILVIVILGILAVVALPRFIDLQDEAQQSAVEGVAGALAAGAAINYAASLAGSGEAVSIDDCDELGATLQGGLPTGYQIVSSGLTGGQSGDCDVTFGGNFTVTFTGYGVD